MTRQQYTATTPAIWSATIPCSLTAFFNAFFYIWCGPIRSSPSTSEISFTLLWGFLSKRLFLFLSIILSFCFCFYLKMSKGLFQISQTFLFLIKFDVWDTLLHLPLFWGALNVRSGCSELFYRRLLSANKFA